MICSSEGMGCSGVLKLELRWQIATQIRPHISAALRLEPMQIQLHTHHLQLLSRLADCIDAAAAASSVDAAPSPLSVGEALRRD